MEQKHSGDAAELQHSVTAAYSVGQSDGVESTQAGIAGARALKKPAASVGMVRVLVGVKLFQTGTSKTSELMIEAGIGEGWNQNGIVNQLQTEVCQREKRLESYVDVQYEEHVERK